MECNSIEYSLSLFNTDFPEYGYALFMRDQPTSPFYKNDDQYFFYNVPKKLIEINVYYESENYVEIFDQPTMDLI